MENLQSSESNNRNSQGKKKLLLAGLAVLLSISLTANIVQAVFLLTPPSSEVEEESDQIQEDSVSQPSNIESEPTELMQSEGDLYSLEPYTSENIRGYIVNKKTFGTDEVLHICHGAIVEAAFRGGVLCLGANYVILKVKDDEIIIQHFDSTTLSETQTLDDIILLNQEILLVAMSHDGCLAVDGLCASQSEITYSVSLTDYSVQELDNDLIGFWNFNQFSWNENETKGIMTVACVEGCPLEKYYSYDVETDTARLLLTNDDGIVVPKTEKIEWTGLDTVVVEGHQFTIE